MLLSFGQITPNSRIFFPKEIIQNIWEILHE